MTPATSMQERPLITFFVIAYNQERYVREAVEGAFSQTYSPLEIILSDDCSSDRTYKIIEEMAAAYRGPHTIVLNRNAKNLGIGGHINRIMELARGELIVAAAGDDVSLPERTDRIYEAYNSSQGTAMSIYSAQRIMDEEGRMGAIHHQSITSGLLDLARRVPGAMVQSLPGASHAWHRKVFDVFGPMLPETVHEDAVIPFRSGLLGTIVTISHPLVLRRLHSGCINAMGRRPGEPMVPTRQYLFARAATRMRRKLVVLSNYRADLGAEHAEVRLDSNLLRRLMTDVEKEIVATQLEIRLLEGNALERLFVVLRGVWMGIGVRKWMKMAAKCVSPSSQYRRLLGKYMNAEGLRYHPCGPKPGCVIAPDTVHPQANVDRAEPF